MSSTPTTPTDHPAPSELAPDPVDVFPRTEPRPIPDARTWLWRTIFAASVSLVAWSVLGEGWTLTGDGEQYLTMAAGERGAAPFGYRTLTPALAGLLRTDPVLAFRLVNWTALVTAAVALTGWARARAPRRERAAARPVAAVVLGLFLVSFAVVYYGTILVAVDPPALALLALALWLLAKEGSPWVIGGLLAFAVLAHETALVLVPLLVLDRVLAARALSSRPLDWPGVAAVTACGIGAYVAARASVPVVETAEQISYLTTPTAIVAHVLERSGGLVTHAQRAYAAWGPALVYALIGGVVLARGRARLFVPAVVGVAVTLSLLATDTLRVMAVIFPVVLLAAAQLVVHAARTHGRTLAAGLIGAQIGYAALVFAHLRSFEGSRTLQLAAIALSAVACGLALLAVRSSDAARVVRLRRSEAEVRAGVVA